MDLLRNTTQKKKRNDSRLKTCEVQIRHVLLSGLLWGEFQTNTFTETDSDQHSERTVN